MSAGTMTARRAALRWRVMPAVLISLAAGLGSVVPAPHAAADAARMAGSPGSPAGPGSPVTAYVANDGSGTVTPIATATNTAGPPITVGNDPCHRDHAGRQDRLRRQRRLGHGDPDRDRHQHRRAADHGRERPYAIAITPDGKTAYVANVGLGHGDPDRDRHQHRRPADHGRRRPSAIAITPDGKTAYVTNFGSDTVTPIATATNTAGPPITVGNSPCAIAITPDGKTAYVANARPGTVTPIATATNTAGPPITVGNAPYAIAITPDGKTAYVANSVLRHGDPDRDRHQHRRPADHGREQPQCHRDHAGRQDRLRHQRRLGHGDPDRDRHQHRRAADHRRNDPYGIAITPDGKTAYVANYGSGTVTPIATATNTAGPPITVRQRPRCHRDHARHRHSSARLYQWLRCHGSRTGRRSPSR